MFGNKPKPRRDLPAIDITKKPEKGIFGRTKMVPTTKKEQRQMKETLMKEYPDRYYVDDLKEYNSVKQDLSWIDCLEEFDAFMDDL